MAEAKKIKITLVRSLNRCLPNQVKNARALGLGKISSTVIADDTPSVRGMIRVVAHLVKVEEI
ncbi:MAG: 50S ribosomal protein L30 [Sphaerochaetaceae bacterium]|nr:50S ribosomal protein L30 [Spirochaetales bacterium]MDY5500899.1 50S ribosomal protein L30 [Sphaerochaetaceae bacterium]